MRVSIFRPAVTAALLAAAAAALWPSPALGLDALWPTDVNAQGHRLKGLALPGAGADALRLQDMAIGTCLLKATGVNVPTFVCAAAGTDYQAPMTAADASILFPSASTIRLRDVTGLSVMGRTGSSAGSAQDITASTPSTFLGLNAAGTAVLFQAVPGTSVTGAPNTLAWFNGSGVLNSLTLSAEFGSIVGGTLSLAANGVANAKLAQMPARSFKVNATNATGTPSDLACTGAGQVPQDTGTALVCQQLAYTSLSGSVPAITSLTGPITATGPGAAATTITNSAVTYAKIQNETGGTFLGNPAGSPAPPSEVAPVAPLAFSGTNLQLNVDTSLNVAGGLLQRNALTGAITSAAGSSATAFGAAGAFTVLMNATGSSAVPTFVGPAGAGQFLGQTGWSAVPSGSLTGTANTVPFFNASGVLSESTTALSYDPTNIRLGSRVPNGAPLYQLHLVSQSADTDYAGRGITQTVYNGGATSSPVIRLQTSGGTFASPSIVSNTMYGGTLQYSMYDGSTFLPVVQTGAHATALSTPATGNLPSEWYVYTSATGVTDPYSSGLTLFPLRALSAGSVAVNTARGFAPVDPLIKFYVSGHQAVVSNTASIAAGGLPYTVVFQGTGASGSGHDARVVLINPVSGVDQYAEYSLVTGLSVSNRGGFLKTSGAISSAAGYPNGVQIFNGDGNIVIITGQALAAASAWFQEQNAASAGQYPSVAFGADFPLASTTGFLYTGSMAGTPTGVPGTPPNSFATSIAQVWDRTHGRLYGYLGHWAPVAQDTTAMATGFLRNTTGTGVWSIDTTTYAAASTTVTGTAPINIAGDHAAHDLSANRTWALDTNGVTYPFLQQGGALSIPGRAANSAGNWADIVATAGSGGVFRESGSTLGFGNITEGVVTNLTTDLAGKQATGNYITALTGDVTAAGPGSAAATIAANAVTNAKAAQMGAGTLKGNNTGSTANALDLTGTQVTAMLNAFTSSLQGLAPASGGGTTNFLRADGTWAAPPAGGGGTITAVTATSPVASSGGTAPQITLTYGSGLLNSGGTLVNSLITGSSGGQVAIGGTGAGESLLLTSTISGTKGVIELGNGGTRAGWIDESVGKTSWGQNSVDARMHVVTTDDTTPGTVTAWDSRHFVVGGSGSTTGGFGVSTTSSTSTVNLSAVAPNTAWWNIRVDAASFGIYPSGSVTPGLFQDSSGNVSVHSLVGGGAVRADISGNLVLGGTPYQLLARYSFSDQSLVGSGVSSSVWLMAAGANQFNQDATRTEYSIPFAVSKCLLYATIDGGVLGHDITFQLTRNGSNVSGGSVTIPSGSVGPASPATAVVVVSSGSASDTYGLTESAPAGTGTWSGSVSVWCQ